MPSTKVLTDHDEIREWAEARGARPACVKGTGRGKNDVGMIRLDFPGYSGEESLQPISWDEWFRQFDKNNLALLVQDTTRTGRPSNFNKLVQRDTVQAKSRRAPSARGRKRTSASRRTTGSARTSSSRAAARRSGTSKAARARSH